MVKPNGEFLREIRDELEELLSALHAYHRDRARGIAQTLIPGLTDEDLLNPDNFDAVISDTAFMYEDGTAAGVMAAKIAVRERLTGLLADD